MWSATFEAAIAGRENVVAGTDCSLGGRVHADLMQGVVLSENREVAPTRPEHSTA